MNMRTGLFIMFFMLLFCGRLPAEDMPAPIVPDDKENIDTILATLNEALEENRSLRGELERLDATFREMTVENNVLKSRLNKLDSRQAKEEDEKLIKIRTLEQQITAIHKDKEDLAQRESAHLVARQEAEAKAQAVEAENEKIQKLLAGAILEDERDKFVKLLHRAQADSSDALEKVQTISKQYEALKKDFAEATYELGHMLFQASDFEGAIARFEQALVYDPNHAWSHYNLGIIYDYYLQKPAKAAPYYQRYLQLEPIEQESLKIRERVVELTLKEEIKPRFPIRLDFLNYTKDLEEKAHPPRVVPQPA